MHLPKIYFDPKPQKNYSPILQKHLSPRQTPKRTCTSKIGGLIRFSLSPPTLQILQGDSSDKYHPNCKRGVRRKAHRRSSSRNLHRNPNLMTSPTRKLNNPRHVLFLQHLVYIPRPCQEKEGKAFIIDEIL